MTSEQLFEVNKGLEEWGLENVANIILIKSGATNGDIVRAAFPNMETDIAGGVVKADRNTRFDLGWWNAPYIRRWE